MTLTRRAFATTLATALGGSVTRLPNALRERPRPSPSQLDRKSTRLNSSHSQTSYAAFCLKKKKPQHLIFFFFNDTATTEIYTLSLHDALPISEAGAEVARDRGAGALRR